MIALFSMKCKSMAWRYALSRRSFRPRGGAHVGKITAPPQDRPRTSTSAYRITRSHRSLPHLRTANRTVPRRPDWVHILWPCQSTYFAWSQNRKIRTAPWSRRRSARPSTFSCNTGSLVLCSGRSSGRIAYYIRDFPWTRVLHTLRNIFYVRMRIFSLLCSACV